MPPPHSFLATLYSSSWAGKARRTFVQLRCNVDRSDNTLIDRSRTLAYDVNDHAIVSHARHLDHVPVTLLSRECLYGGIRRWILSLSLYYLLLLPALGQYAYCTVAV